MRLIHPLLYSRDHESGLINFSLGPESRNSSHALFSDACHCCAVKSKNNLILFSKPMGILVGFFLDV